jgi:hypothetical protein
LIPPALFNVHGLRFGLHGNARFAYEGLAEDFAFFRAENGAAQLQIHLHEEEPDYSAVPTTEASVYTPRNVVYRDGPKRYLDFGGRALALFDPTQNRFQIASRDPHLVYEAAYLFLLSQIGQHVDRRSLHRLHALAMSYRGRSILVMLPMGGGKSTLGSALLRHDELQILSDDSPFIDGHSRAHAFPLRIGLLPGSEHEVPEEHRRLIQRMEFGSKYLVNYSYFAQRVAPAAGPGLLVLGRRTMAPQPAFRPATYAQTMQSLVPNLILGVGLFQGLEYLLNSSAMELFGRIQLAWSRTKIAHRLARRSHNYIFAMSRDVEANATALLALAKEQFGG